MNLFGHLMGLLCRGISPTQGLYLRVTTQHRKTQTHTHIYASRGIRTHDPSVRAAEDSTSLRLRGHWGRSKFVVFFVITPYSVMDMYEGFGGPCCLHLQGLRASSVLRYPTTTLHGATIQATMKSLEQLIFFPVRMIHGATMVTRIYHK